MTFDSDLTDNSSLPLETLVSLKYLDSSSSRLLILGRYELACPSGTLSARRHTPQT